MWPGLILVDGEIAGRITLNNILRGPLQCCFVGYWVARAHAGHGVATEALRQALDVAFGALRLHRVEAFTRARDPLRPLHVTPAAPPRDPLRSLRVACPQGDLSWRAR